MTGRARAGLAARIGAVALAYAVAGRFGLALAVVNPSASAIWPPTGIAMAAGLLVGPWAAVGIWLGAFWVNATVASTPWIAAVIATGNTLEGALGASLVRRYAGGLVAFRNTRGLLRFIALAGFGATLVSPTIGVTAVVAGGGARWSDFGPIWLTWWLGDAAGALLVTPLLVLWSGPVEAGAWRPRLTEGAMVAALLGIAGQLVFGWAHPRAAANLPLGFLLVPVLLWAGLRLGPRIAAAAGAMLAAMALAGTMRGSGPFAVVDPATGLLLLQGYVTVSALTALLVATLAHEQGDAIATLGRANAMTTSGYLRQGQILIEAEEELRRRDEMNSALLQAVEDIGEGLAVIDVETGRFISVNAALCELYGYTEPELLALPSFWALIAAEDLDMVRERKRQRDRGERVPDHYELTVLHRSGRRVRIEASMKILRSHPGSWIVALVRDVTERRREDELRRARDIADAANRAKSRFLATVSHELRTPLTAIIGFANLLGRREPAALDGEARRNIERIQVNSRELLETINDLLDLAKIEAGRMEMVVGPVELAPFVADIVGHFEVQARQKGIEILAEAEAGLPVVETDGGKLRRILMNLVGNALKFTPEGSIAVRAERDGASVAIRVADTGIGIPADKLAEVFEAFQQVEEGSARTYGGVGLGLAISRSLSDMLGSRLEVASELGRGTEFTLRLPPQPRGADAAEAVAATEGTSHG